MEIKLTEVPLLADNQDFYKEAYLKNIKDAAINFVGTLYLLAKQGNKVAFNIFKQTKNVDSTTNLFFQFREINALAQSLHFAYAKSDDEQVARCLQGLYFLLIPYYGGYSLGRQPLDNIVLEAGSHIHAPTIASTIKILENDITLGKVANYLADNGNLNSCPFVEVIKDTSTASGIRISLVSTQPTKVGFEFDIIGTGVIPNIQSVELVQKALSTFSNVDYGLATSTNNLLRVVSVAPKEPGIRRAGSISSIPGWAWQDVDLEEDPDLEFCHLVTQLIHEFFHTKLYLVEKNIALYNGDGNTPEVFSPWKNRLRPLRQVIHALTTFSASAKAWARLLEIPWLSKPHLSSTAEEFWKENLGFAIQAQSDLLKSGGLTKNGEIYIEAIVDDLKKYIGNK